MQINSKVLQHLVIDSANQSCSLAVPVVVMPGQSVMDLQRLIEQNKVVEFRFHKNIVFCFVGND